MAVNRMRNNQNSTNNMQEMPNGSQARSAALTGSLSEKIQKLSFVKEELELYLDTHPSCRTALDYYQKTLMELERLTEQYENEVGPLTAAGVRSTDEWTWIGGPWPWQNEKMKGRE